MVRHINLLRQFSVPLLAGVAVALILANAAPEMYHALVHEPVAGSLNLHFLTNDLFMVLFFGIAAAEITASCHPGGDLNPPSRAANALIATVGGIVGPAAVFLGLNACFGSPSLANGWGIPTATDIALAWLVARIIFGADHPAVSFLLLLAIADDAAGLVIIALFYPNAAMPLQPLWLLLIPTGMALAWLLRRKNVLSYWPYLACGGVLSWVGLHRGNMHPALALAFIVPFLPHPRREEGHLFEEEAGRAPGPLHGFVHDWRLVVDFGMFLFGLVNAGVQLGAVGPATGLVLAGLAAGKTAGVFLFGWIAHLAGVRLPRHVGYRELLLIGIVAGIGFTVSLFIAGEAFTDPTVQAAARMGALLSIGLSIPAILLGKMLKIGRKERPSQ